VEVVQDAPLRRARLWGLVSTGQVREWRPGVCAGRVGVADRAMAPPHANGSWRSEI